MRRAASRKMRKDPMTVEIDRHTVEREYLQIALIRSAGSRASTHDG